MEGKAVILITGQKKRLELLSKIKYIIAPMSKKYDIVVVLSLSETDHFTNKYKYAKNFKYNVCEIHKELGRIPHYNNDIIYPELKLNNTIVSMYDKEDLGEIFRKHRAENHVRQYYTLSNSWSIIKELNPDILIRIRDDATLSKSLDLTELSTLSFRLRKCIITPSENSWGGINDKFAIVSKEAIETYLNKPLQVYHTYKNEFNQRISNPEQFLKNVYATNGVSLQVSNINIKIIGQ